MAPLVKIVDPTSHDGWDEMIFGLKEASFFHTSFWAKSVSQSYGYKPVYFLIISPIHGTSIFPFMEIDSFLTGIRGVSLPFTDFCEPIISHTESEQIAAEAISNYGRTHHWKYFEMRGWSQSGVSLTTGEECFEHVLNLQGGTEQIWKSIRDSTKRNIQKAKKMNLTYAIEGTQAALGEFCRLNGLTRQKHGLPPQPKRFFQNVWDFIIKPGRGTIVSAYKNGECLSSCMYFYFGKKAYYKYGASNPKYLECRPNNLVFWAAIENFSNKGFDTLSFGKTLSDNKGLMQFKDGWGAEKVRKYYLKKNMSGQFLPYISNVRGAHNKIFANLPLFLSQWIGTVMYRHIG